MNAYPPTLLSSTVPCLSPPASPRGMMRSSRPPPVPYGPLTPALRHALCLEAPTCALRYSRPLPDARSLPRGPSPPPLFETVP
ncbi:hypothetical protein KY284_013760 [Solanum tuberosum]|nr:hypothetical protein KY284_013760 [Solanum tuberosum]